MSLREILSNLFLLLAAGVLLVIGFGLLRKGLRLFWKLARFGLILIAAILIAGYFLGIVEINLW